MKRVLICGGVDYDKYYTLSHALHFFCRKTDSMRWEVFRSWGRNDRIKVPNILIIHGAAIGADSLADIWARENKCPVESYPAEWDKYGKKAGYIRNQQMIDEGYPDVVIAFPGGKGTAMMKRLARKSGIPVLSGEKLAKEANKS